MSEKKQQPAMTPEEWRGCYVDLELGTVDVRLDGHWGVVPQARAQHALAALLLRDQPYGFTWDDVDLLGRAAAQFGVEDGRREGVQLIADRIAALLPPREES